MAVAFVKNHTVASNKTAGTTLAIPLDTDVSAGNLIVLRILYDNAGTAFKPLVSSITKAAGETAVWSLGRHNESGSTSAGAFVGGHMTYILTTVTWPAGSYTVTLDTSTVQKAGFFQEFSGALGAESSGTVQGTNYSTTTTAASVTTTGTAPAIGNLVLGFIYGSNVAAAQAGDNDTTGGSWSAVAGVGSTGGGGTVNNFGVGQYKILTSATHQTLNNSAAMTAGNGAIITILRPSTAGPTDRTGVATGSISLAGASSGIREMAGAATGALTLTGAASGAPVTAPVLATATGALTLSSTAAGVRPMTGTATGALALAGTASGQKTVAGTATGTLSVAGVAAGTHGVTATATGALTLTGTGSGQKTVTATAVGAVTLAGTSSGIKTVAATATGALTVAGSAAGLRVASGTATGSLTLTGTAVGQRTATATATGSLTLAGTATGQKSVTATAAGQITVTSSALGLVEGNAVGIGNGAITLGGAAAGVRDTKATATGALTVTGLASGTRGRPGVAVAAITLTGLATGTKDVTALATGNIGLTGGAVGAGVVSNVVGQWNTADVVAYQWGADEVVEWFMVMAVPPVEATATGFLTVVGAAAGGPGKEGHATGTITILAAAAGVGAAAGRVLINDDCDNFTDAPWTINGSVTIAAAHTGNGFQFATGSTVRASYDIPTIDQTDTITVGMHLKLGTLVATHDVLQFRSDAGATFHISLRTGSNGSLTVTRGGTTQLGTAAPASTLVVATWYFVEMSVKLHDTLGAATVRVDGTPVITATSVDTRNAGTKAVLDQFRLNSVGSTTAWQVDNVYVRNDSTFSPT